MWLSICIEVLLLATLHLPKGVCIFSNKWSNLSLPCPIKGIFSYKWTNLSLPCPIRGIFLLQMLTGFASSFRLETITGLMGSGCVTSLLYLLLCDLERHNLVECIV